jgi:hypothetical protein
MLDIPFHPRASVNLLSLYGALGLTISAIVHFSTYFGHALDPHNPLFWALHIGIFPLFFAFVLRLGVWQGVKRGLFGLQRRRLLWRELLVYFPPWVPALVVLLFVYAAANFFLSMRHLPPTGATPVLPNTPAALYTTRAFSGHWLIFYASPALFFAFVPRDARPPADGPDGAA